LKVLGSRPAYLPAPSSSDTDRVFVFVEGALRRELSGNSLDERELVGAMNLGAERSVA
jgi:hypothetical protein